MVQSSFTQKLTGEDFEDICAKRALKYQSAGLAHVKRYGVQAVRKRDYNPVTKEVEYRWQVIPSKPDFDGVLPYARPFMFDCKVESGSSFSLSDYREDTKGPRRRQLTFMYERARYGVKCFFLIHWNARTLETKSDPAMTIGFPVHPLMAFWEAFEAGEKKSISRKECVELGKVVPWTLFGPHDQLLQPDFLAML